jgi:cell wall-associated NlpC family hydrolase
VLLPDRVAIVTAEQPADMKDGSISLTSLTQSYALKGDMSPKLQNLKVYLPESEENPSNFPRSGGNMPLNSLDPEISRFNQVMQSAIDEQLTDRPFGEIMQAIAEQFIGTPYVAGLLDKSNQETLVVTLKGFDCVLFIETVLAIARGVAVQDYAYENFRDRIQEQRYRDGQLNGYCSRLHYFSDWIDNNQNRRIVYNLSNLLGGIPLNTTLNFMTENRQYYAQLANESEYECILNQEGKLANLDIRYIPQDQIATIYPYLQPGDIIATATDIPGLDVTPYRLSISLS